MDALEILQTAFPGIRIDVTTLITGLMGVFIIVCGFNYLRDIFCLTDADLKHQAKTAQKKRNKECDDKYGD